MGNENATKLKARASELAEKLQAQGIHAEVICDSLREYSIKVALPIGLAVIYYSPKMDSFKCQQDNVDDEDLWLKVLACWGGTEPRPLASANDIQVGSGAVDIYVDGSFVEGNTAYGVVAVRQGQAIWEDSGIVAPTVAEGTRQVAGELQAVLNALKWCQMSGLEAITIHYDYEGIEKWAIGKWKAKIAVTQQYRDAVHSSGIQITWQKVDAHTGVKWNEYVDQLARSAAVAPNTQPATTADPVMELNRTVTEFSEFLQKHEIVITTKRRFEAPIPRLQLTVSSGEDAWGYLYFYFSQEKGPYPKLHEVRPKEKRQRLELLWREFKAPPVDDLREVNYYFTIFKPYKSLNFDFRVLAESIARIWDQRRNDPLDIDSVRYDFAGLEKCRDVLLGGEPT